MTDNVTKHDPIFAAIELYRKAYAAHTAACETGDDNISRAACNRQFAALATAVAITPRTLAGVAAMLRFVHHATTIDGAEDEGQLFAGYARVEPVAADLLLRLADRIEATAT